MALAVATMMMMVVVVVVIMHEDEWRHSMGERTHLSQVDVCIQTPQIKSHPKQESRKTHIALSIEYLFIYLFIHYILYECMHLPQNPIKFQDKINDVKNN